MPKDRLVWGCCWMANADLLCGSCGAAAEVASLSSLAWGAGVEVLGCDKAAAPPLLLLGRLWAAAANTPDMSAAAQLSSDSTSRTWWSGEASGRLPTVANPSQGLAAPESEGCDLPEACGGACWVSMRCGALGGCCAALLLGSVPMSEGEVLSREGCCAGGAEAWGTWAAGTGIAQASSDMTVPAESVLPRARLP